mmetsp:Transcript_8325/g.11883  ORF Transcript_8325/g.11883 Transcript_8325/m.11883 type:complete len:92 (-) Transcript_8325:388-663(-)
MTKLNNIVSSSSTRTGIYLLASSMALFYLSYRIVFMETCVGPWKGEEEEEEGKYHQVICLPMEVVLPLTIVPCIILCIVKWVALELHLHNY